MVRSPDRPPVAVTGLTVGYEPGRPVLVDVDLLVPGPGTTLLSGANGSGKSTLVDVLSGYLVPWRGVVHIAGRAAHHPASRAARRVCRTHPALMPALTAREHLDFACRLVGSPIEVALGRAAAYGLGPWLDREVGELSTGSARKLWLTLCTLGDPEVTVLDEPFNGLDADARLVLLEEIRRWTQNQAVLVVAHDPPEDLPVDRIVTLPCRDTAGVGSTPATC